MDKDMQFSNMVFFFEIVLKTSLMTLIKDFSTTFAPVSCLREETQRLDLDS